MNQPWLKYKLMPVAFKSHYLDSGSFSLMVNAKRYAKANNCDPMLYYDTAEFWQYVDDYCKFVTKYRAAIDDHSVMDVIPNAERTWKCQQYMEDYGLNPVPVVHYGTDLKWLKKYMDRGHKFIAIGVMGKHGQVECRNWLDKVFQMVSDPDGFPVVKLHGFAITRWELLVRFPWWSVDSASWLKIGAFGGVMLPHKRKGEFVFTEPPHIVKCAHESPERKKAGGHLLTMSPMEQSVFYEWLEKINIPLGKMNYIGEIKKIGVINDHSSRLTANLIYFEELAKHVPKWPWAFRSTHRKGFGIAL